MAKRHCVVSVWTPHNGPSELNDNLAKTVMAEQPVEIFAPAQSRGLRNEKEKRRTRAYTSAMGVAFFLPLGAPSSFTSSILPCFSNRSRGDSYLMRGLVYISVVVFHANRVRCRLGCRNGCENAQLAAQARRTETRAPCCSPAVNASLPYRIV